MMKKNRGKLIVSSLVILLPILAGLLLWDRLPGQMIGRWGLGETAASGGARAAAVFLPPLFMLIIHWICIWFTCADPKNRDQSEKAMGMIFWIAPAFSLYLNGILYGTAFGMTFSMDQMMSLTTGLVFLLIGNYLPKCRQNRTLGIKVKWALENEENWNRTHRFGGRVWVICGLLMMLAVFLPGSWIGLVLPVLMTVIAVLPIAYSYLYHRKQIREGSAAAAAPRQRGGREEAVFAKISGSFTAVILVGVAILLFTGSLKVEYGDTSFSVEASYWGDLTIPYEEIDSIELRRENVPGSRVGGFGSFRLLMGSFENDEFGRYTRYTYTNCNACIVLTADGRVFVISGSDETATEAIYEALTDRIR